MRCMTRLLIPAEVAETLRVCSSWVMRNAKEIGGFKLGKSWRFRPEDVERFLDEQKAKARKETV